MKRYKSYRECIAMQYTRNTLITLIKSVLAGITLVSVLSAWVACVAYVDLGCGLFCAVIALFIIIKIINK